MPSGKTHDQINNVVLIPLCILVFFLSNSLLLTVLLAFGYIFGSYYLSPDLDTYSLPYKRWGVFRYIWRLYQKIGGHRSTLSFSHDLFLGFWVRLLYLFLVISFFLIIFSIVFLSVYYWVNQEFILVDFLEYIIVGLKKLYYWIYKYKIEFLCIILGAWIGNIVHVLSDWLAGVKKFMGF